MSITTTMLQLINILRDMIGRDNGDIVNGGKLILDALAHEVDRVQLLETMAALNTKEVCTYQQQGEDNEPNNR